MNPMKQPACLCQVLIHKPRPSRILAHAMLYAECSNQVLLQTARAPLFNPLRPNKQIVSQFVLDPGSQSSYVTESC